ncbi:MAG: NTP transferase domain-containing protein [Candidatus Omnitrophica bacterium]|nr:NTP transferase domain-containing protein [Candidatus Omnitrophota bacterium]
MKGIVLAGGLGSRLYPLTKVTNKHLLPVYNKPMVYYPIETLVRAGIKDILLVTGGNSAGDFLKLLGDGKEFGLTHVNYTYQEGEGGIAAALSLAKDFADGEKVVVILGDNVIEDNVRTYLERFKNQKKGARLLLKEVPDPERFGVAELKGDKVVGIVEKPKKPKTNYAVVGFYMFDSDVFKIISTLKPSKRGELEITDVSNVYLRRGELEFDVLKGYWSDAGTFESLFRANRLVARKAGIQQ